MLDAASIVQPLPEVITILDANSYHYAADCSALEVLEVNNLNGGLSASTPVGDQVSIAVAKTNATNGAVESLGNVVIQLFAAEGEAPNSAEHFLSLVQSGYYEGLNIHRIETGIVPVVQGGSIDGYGYYGSGSTTPREYSDLLTHSGRGMVAFARKGNDPDSSESQIYVTLDAIPALDIHGNQYNLFGYVVDGYDVLQKLEEAQTTTKYTYTYVDENGEEHEANLPSPAQNYPVDKFTFNVVGEDGQIDENAKAVQKVAEADKTHSVLRLVTTDNGEELYPAVFLRGREVLCLDGLRRRRRLPGVRSKRAEQRELRYCRRRHDRTQSSDHVRRPNDLLFGRTDAQRPGARSDYTKRKRFIHYYHGIRRRPVFHFGGHGADR